MDDAEREALLIRWSRPSSDDEVAQQERATRMVTDAIAESPLASVSKRIYAKGSYANNTNVRRDSDVDIAIDCHECMYYESHDNVVPKVVIPSYTGPWTPPAWRNAIAQALAAKFAGETDTFGSVAIHIPMVQGSRPNIDVVPGFHHRKYFAADGSSYEDGSKVFPTSGGEIVNWPDQQLANGRAKNDATGKRYKGFVRVLKNAENQLAESGSISDMPSYLMECLLYNVDDNTLRGASWSDAFRATLQELWQGLSDHSVWSRWLEPNRLKWALAGGDKKWSVTDGKEVVQGTWNLLGYA
jgi:hypothetical protein